jgi:hypothetical protein
MPATPMNTLLVICRDHGDAHRILCFSDRKKAFFSERCRIELRRANLLKVLWKKTDWQNIRMLKNHFMDKMSIQNKLE